MFTSDWFTLFALLSCGVAVVALRPYARQRPLEGNDPKLIKAAAGLRLMLGVAMQALLFVLLARRMGALPEPAHSMAWAVAIGCAVVWLGNCAVGLWLASPLSTVSPGRALIASGRRGTLVGYGVARLELRTRGGWTAHVPYLNVAARVLLVGESERPHRETLVFERPAWSDAEVQLLHQLVVLAPYRQIDADFDISRRAGRVIVRLSLVKSCTGTRMQEYVERALTALPPAAPRLTTPPRE
jgi:hypothetical protein